MKRVRSVYIVPVLLSIIVLFGISIISVAFSEEIKFQGIESSVDYNFYNASFEGINLVESEKLIEFIITPQNEGTATISLPRELIDAQLGGVDIDFSITLITANDFLENFEYEEIANTDTKRIISINFPQNTFAIAIRGTQMAENIMIIQETEVIIEKPKYPKSGKIEFKNGELILEYSITNGIIQEIELTPDNWINFVINSQSDGVLTVNLPEEFEISTFKEKNKIWILVDSEEITYSLKANPKKSVVIPFTIGSEIIEIYYELKAKSSNIPEWVKNNAKWWSEGRIGDSDFVSGIQFMIKEKIINIPDLPEQSSETAEEKVPDWIRNNAGWWADGLITEDDFVKGIEYLVEQGIIRV